MAVQLSGTGSVKKKRQQGDSLDLLDEKRQVPRQVTDLVFPDAIPCARFRQLEWLHLKGVLATGASSKFNSKAQKVTLQIKSWHFIPDRITQSHKWNIPEDFHRKMFRQLRQRMWRSKVDIGRKSLQDLYLPRKKRSSRPTIESNSDSENTRTLNTSCCRTPGIFFIDFVGDCTRSKNRPFLARFRKPSRFLGVILANASLTTNASTSKSAGSKGTPSLCAPFLPRASEPRNPACASGKA